MNAAQLTHLFVHTAKTQRATVSKDSGGGEILTWADNLTGVKGRFNAMGGLEYIGKGRIVTDGKSKFYTAPNQDITQKDRLIYNARTFDIVNITDFDELGIYVRLEMDEVLPSAGA